MKKLIYILLLVLLLNSCNKITPNPFNDLIKNYPHNPDKLYEYENIYNTDGVYDENLGDVFVVCLFDE